MSRLTALLDRHGLRTAKTLPVWIAGNDTRSLLRRWRDVLAGEAGLVHVFGDSQSSVYASLPGTVVHLMAGKTMHAVGRGDAAFLRRTRWRLGRSSILMFAFGGVDARRHIGRIAEAAGLPLATVIHDTVEAYLNAIDARRGARRVCLVGLLPPAPSDEIGPTLDSWGTQGERAAIVKGMNRALAEGCAKRGFALARVSPHYEDENGFSLPGIYSDGVHLKPEVEGPARAEAAEALGSLRGRP